MARTTSSSGKKPRSSSSGAGAKRDSAPKRPPESPGMYALLIVPRALGTAVRSLCGVGEYDPDYRRDGLCFVMIVLAIFFCASEWFRVDGVLGLVLHAIASGLFGVMSVIVPVLLVIVALRLMRNSGSRSDNPRVVTGWMLLLWSVCSIIDVAVAADVPGFHIDVLQKAGGLLGFVLGSPLAWGLSDMFAIVVFVVVALFSVMMITRTHVVEIPDRLREMRERLAPPAAEDGDDYPNEVRIGDETLAFAQGVPAHDGSDDDAEDGARSRPRFGFLSRLFSRRHADGDPSLDRYAGDDPFDHAAERHGDAAETSLLDRSAGLRPRTVASDGLSSLSPSAMRTAAMPSGGLVDDDPADEVGGTRVMPSGSFGAAVAPTPSAGYADSSAVPATSAATGPAGYTGGADPWAGIASDGTTIVKPAARTVASSAYAGPSGADAEASGPAATAASATAGGAVGETASLYKAKYLEIAIFFGQLSSQYRHPVQAIAVFAFTIAAAC